MKKIILSLILVITVTSINWGQNLSTLGGGCILEVNEVSSAGSAENFFGNPNAVKHIRLNMHFMLKTDGTGNFTEIDDGRGNPLTGYQYAKDLVTKMNLDQTWNPPMHLLPGNTTPNLPKNYFYVLEAVYFHRNTALHTNPNYLTVEALGQHTDSLVNIYYTGGNPLSGGAGGYVISEAMPSTSKRKFTICGAYKRYEAFIDGVWPIDFYEWAVHAITRTTEHEIGHLMGLNHTVLSSTGNPCSATITSTCGDHCSDTPSAYEAFTVTGTHPSGGWEASSNHTNNFMDYSKYSALTPCQLERIHDYLDGGMASYRQCSALYTDLAVCNLGPPYLAYNGKNVTIGECASGAVLNGQETMSIYFSESVSLKNFEVSDNGTFEVVFASNCD